MENKEKSQFPTPRTDELATSIAHDADYCRYNYGVEPNPAVSYGRLIDFARSLERELTEANARISNADSLAESQAEIIRDLDQKLAEFNDCATMDELRATRVRLTRERNELSVYAVALEAALVHVTDVDDYQPHSCEECAQIKALLQGIYEKRLKGATTNTEYQMNSHIPDGAEVTLGV